MKIVVGLGNPGVEYSQTRHNLGFMALDDYVDKLSGVWQSKPKFSAVTAEATIGDEKVVFVKPLTFYNLVGEAVQKVSAFYKVTLDDVLVVHDEMALSLGTIRTRVGGSDAGNNGIKNIINVCGMNFARLRIGSGVAINTDGCTRPGGNCRNYVLGRLNAADTEIFLAELPTIKRIIDSFIAGNFTETTYKTTPKTSK